jgi:internalin A
MQADYIPVEKYFEICSEQQVLDEDLQESLLDILNVLGTVVRLAGDTQVLKPKWVTQGVYGLLTSSHVVRTQGQFDLNDVGEILSGLPGVADHYPTHTHRRLIEVMKYFELCFEFTDRPGHYLIPRQLHDEELNIPWNDADALRFEYHYDTLPDAIISRFIVRMNQYITNQYYWKNGVFLHSEENRARIKADLIDRKIFMSVIGKEQTRRAFLAIIRSTFAEINGNFKIAIKQMIPAPGLSPALVSYDDLLIHEEMNEPEIFVPELRTRFSVRELLDGIENPELRLGSQEVKYRRESRAATVKVPDIESKQENVPARNNPSHSLVSFVLGFVLVLGTILVTAIAISKWVSVAAGVMTGIIVISALVAIGLIGALTLRNDGRLSEETFLQLMIESYRRLSLIKDASPVNNDKEIKPE